MSFMEILPRPQYQEDSSTGPQLWIDEQIWGHRLHDEQTPWLTMLEFLGILHAEHRQGRALSEARLNELTYRPQLQLRLRNLLFNNPHMAVVRASGKNDEGMWTQWLDLMSAGAGGLENKDFSYLRDRFETFKDFDAVVSFLQGSSIEGGGNKRWSSKFIFPFGVNSLYEDAKVSASGGVSTDRRFFGRTGEILYLMLCRSKRAADLAARLDNRLLKVEGPYDKLVGALQNTAETTVKERAGSYLPCSQYACFDHLAEDWIAVLDLEIPAYDALPHMVTLLGLHILLYQLARAAEVFPEQRKISVVCEIVSPKRSNVRELSANSYQQNNTLPGEALEAFVRLVADTPEWKSALASEEPGASAVEVLSRKFDWPERDDAEKVKASPDALLAELLKTASKRHKLHVGKFHATWARLIGLSSRRASRRTRYAPTDRLLKTLVICAVDGRMEFKEFLEHLHQRYGMVIGDRQAQDFIARGDADQENFSDNARWLEERLASLGLLERLSDSCAFVKNPFKRRFSLECT